MAEAPKVESPGLQLAAQLNIVAESMRACANMTEAFAEALKQANFTGNLTIPMLGAALATSKSSKRKAVDDGAEEGGKRKRRKQPKDPNAPKRPASSYILFQNEVRKSMRETHPNISNAELVALISKQWQEMSEEDKSIYNQAMASAKERYSADKKAYDNRTPEEVAAANAAAAVAALAAKKPGRRSKKQAPVSNTAPVPAQTTAAATSSPSSAESSEQSGSEEDSDSEVEANDNQDDEEDDDDESEAELAPTKTKVKPVLMPITPGRARKLAAPKRSKV